MGRNSSTDFSGDDDEQPANDEPMPPQARIISNQRGHLAMSDEAYCDPNYDISDNFGLRNASVIDNDVPMPSRFVR